ncbi:MAG: hypothetical protein ACLS8R_02930 [Anaeromassilibacillus sp.]
MNCGVPFCQWYDAARHGDRMPLHNLIPEWNDEVYRGNTWHALSRLLKTNNFPDLRAGHARRSASVCAA